MNRLRGLVIVQASWTEAVLGQILRHLLPSANIEGHTAGQLLAKVRRALANLPAIGCNTLDLIDKAIKRRNRAVHDTVTIGYSWAPFSGSGGDGDWVPVISLLGSEECSEADLRSGLALQQEATVAAVQLLIALERLTTQSDT
jgi:hypothetical protein